MLLSDKEIGLLCLELYIYVFIVVTILTNTTCMQKKELRSIAENFICCYQSAEEGCSECERKCHKIPAVLMPGLGISTVLQKIISGPCRTQISGDREELKNIISKFSAFLVADMSQAMSK